MATILLKRGNKATSSAAIAALKDGEPLFIRDDGKLYIGTGTDAICINPDISIDAPVTSVNDKTGAVVLTKTDVGLGNVANLAVNDMAPSYTAATNPAALISGEKLSAAFAKIAAAVTALIAHMSNKSNPHEVTKANVGLGNVTNESKATMFTSPAFTGKPTAPTAAATVNDTQIATTAFVNALITSKGFLTATATIDGGTF